MSGLHNGKVYQCDREWSSFPEFHYGGVAEILLRGVFDAVAGVPSAGLLRQKGARSPADRGFADEVRFGAQPFCARSVGGNAEVERRFKSWISRQIIPRMHQCMQVRCGDESSTTWQMSASFFYPSLFTQ